MAMTDTPHDRELKILVAHPHFQKTLQQFKNDPSDPVTRVHKAVHAAAQHPQVQQLLNWKSDHSQRARALADAAAVHARSALGASSPSSPRTDAPTNAGGKIERDAFLYLPAGKGDKQCKTCASNSNGKCTTLNNLAVQPGWSCGMYLPGSYSGQRAGPYATPEEAGLIKQDVRCENCRYFTEHCELFEKLNQTMPDDFDLDPDVDAKGCCNAFASRTDAGTDAPGAGGQVGAAQDQSTPTAGNVQRVPESQTAGDAGNLRTVIFVRHGSTHLNNDDTSVDRIRGWKDVPLNAEGRQQAAVTGREMRSNPPDKIVASDMERAQESAKILSQQSGAPLTYIGHEFRPWNVGQFAGQVSKKAVPILAKYAREMPDKPLPGGESFNCFKHRLFTGLAKLLENEQGTVAIVTHHRDERLVTAWAAAGFPADGSIDIRVFDDKGEGTGHSEEMQIPLDRVKAVASQTPPCGYTDEKQPVHEWKDDTDAKANNQRTR